MLLLDRERSGVEVGQDVIGPVRNRTLYSPRIRAGPASAVFELALVDLPVAPVADRDVGKVDLFAAAEEVLVLLSTAPLDEEAQARHDARSHGAHRTGNHDLHRSAEGEGRLARLFHGETL